MNWGAFAGGLAQGIEKQQELALKKKQLEEEANNQMIKRQAETEKMLAESEKQKTDFMTKYTDKVLEYETKIADAKDADEMNSQINALNNYKKISRTMAEKLFQADGQNQDNIVNSLNFDFLPKVTNYTIKDVSGNDTTVTLPEGLQAEQLRLMENGNIGQVIVNQQGKEAGVNATTITPTKFKQEKPSKSDFFEVNIGGNKTVMSIEEYTKLQKEGNAPQLWERPKDGGVKVDVKVDTGTKSAEESSEGIDILNESKNRKLTKEEENKLWLAERNFLKNNATSEENKVYAEVESKANTIKQLNKTREVYQKMVDAGIDGGIAQDIIVGTMKYVGSGGKLSELTGITTEKFKQITGIEANLTSQQMEIIKDLSGLSYTDKQMNMMNKITGNKTFTTNEAKINAMIGYIDGIKTEINDLVSTDDRFARKFPHLAYSLDIKNKSIQTGNNNTGDKKTTQKASEILKEKIDGTEYEVRYNKEGKREVKNPKDNKWYTY